MEADGEGAERETLPLALLEADAGARPCAVSGRGRASVEWRCAFRRVVARFASGDEPLDAGMDDRRSLFRPTLAAELDVYVQVLELAWHLPQPSLSPLHLSYKTREHVAG